MKVDLQKALTLLSKAKVRRIGRRGRRRRIAIAQVKRGKDQKYSDNLRKWGNGGWVIWVRPKVKRRTREEEPKSCVLLDDTKAEEKSRGLHESWESRKKPTRGASRPKETTRNAERCGDRQ